MKTTSLRVSTPVVLIIFNRPDTTARVFKAVCQAEPSRLLVIADGPRPDHPEDVRKCGAAQEVIRQVDWDCKLSMNFAETNMGCRQRVSSGLDWVFGMVEEAIVLEDDCLPHPTFFRFCEQLLERYRDDERIMMVSGTNYLGQWKADAQAYHFSYYGGIWGWASWRRAWGYYDVDMELWAKPEVKERVKDVLCDAKQYRQRAELFDRTRLGRIDTWDYQWSFARLSQSGLSIVPSANLVSNIGFGRQSTHTRIPDSRANLPLYPMSFPLREPSAVVVDRAYDRQLWLQLSPRPNAVRRVLSRAKRMWRR